MIELDELTPQQKALVFAKLATSQKIWNRLAKTIDSYDMACHRQSESVKEAFDVEILLKENSFDDLFNFFEQQSQTKTAWKTLVKNNPDIALKSVQISEKAQSIFDEALDKRQLLGMIGDTRATYNNDTDKVDLFISQYFALQVFHTVLTKDIQYKGKSNKVPESILEQLEPMFNSRDIKDIAQFTSNAIQRFKTENNLI